MPEVYYPGKISDYTRKSLKKEEDVFMVHTQEESMEGGGTGTEQVTMENPEQVKEGGVRKKVASVTFCIGIIGALIGLGALVDPEIGAMIVLAVMGIIAYSWE